MIEQIDAIILDSKDYKEKDALLSVLSLKYGILHLVARGIRKINSKNASACLPFTYAKLMVDLKEQRSLHTLQSAVILKSYRKIREDLLKQSIASYFCEMIEKSNFDVFNFAGSFIMPAGYKESFFCSLFISIHYESHAWNRTICGWVCTLWRFT